MCEKPKPSSSYALKSLKCYSFTVSVFCKGEATVCFNSEVQIRKITAARLHWGGLQQKCFGWTTWPRALQKHQSLQIPTLPSWEHNLPTKKDFYMHSFHMCLPTSDREALPLFHCEKWKWRKGDRIQLLQAHYLTPFFIQEKPLILLLIDVSIVQFILILTFSFSV